VQILSLAGSFVDGLIISTKYFRGVIKLGCRSSAIYSFLILLYVKLADEEPLFKFLSAQVPAAATVSNASKKAGLGFAGDGLSGVVDGATSTLQVFSTSDRHFSRTFSNWYSEIPAEKSTM
jgi:hypothetical protein